MLDDAERVDRAVLATVLERLARAAALKHQPETAASLLGAADALWIALGGAQQPFEQRLREATEIDVRTTLGSEEFNRLAAAGAELASDLDALRQVAKTID